jgi:hypothetical protein
MPEGVTYTKESDADDYAEKVGGTVVEVDTDGDGAVDGYNVIVTREPGKDEGVTSGPTTVYGDKEGSVEFEGASARNMGGVVKDELGYMGGGVSYSDRGPIKYSKGGAVSGKNFKGSF